MVGERERRVEEIRVGPATVNNEARVDMGRKEKSSDVLHVQIRLIDLLIRQFRCLFSLL